ncbi:MAG: hypothetical protein GXO09_00685 [Crenarchaeota archaeon]|nr:hypothetical protein [Thermoproteota archaeon]
MMIVHALTPAARAALAWGVVCLAVAIAALIIRLIIPSEPVRRATAAIIAVLLPVILLGEVVPVIIEPRVQVTVLPFILVMKYNGRGVIAIDFTQLFALYLIYEGISLYKAKTRRTPR